MFSQDFTLTKKHLGWMLLIAGGVAFVGIFSIDLVVIASENGLSELFTAQTIQRLRGPIGIGPAQRLALILSMSLAVLGLSLIPLGDHPA